MKTTIKTNYYFKIVEAVASLATCGRGRAGAILVKEGRVIATGYVGAPAGAAHCDDIGHEIETRAFRATKADSSDHCVRTVHAEANALIQAARYGPSCGGADIFCGMFPCYDCAKLIVNAGIVRVWAFHDYQKSKRSKELFDECGVAWTLINEETVDYEERE